MYACVCMCVCICMHVYAACICMHVCACVCKRMHVCICMHVCVHVYACMHVCVHQGIAGMYVCMYGCMYVSLYLCTKYIKVIIGCSSHGLMSDIKGSFGQLPHHSIGPCALSPEVGGLDRPAAPSCPDPCSIAWHPWPGSSWKPAWWPQGHFNPQATWFTKKKYPGENDLSGKKNNGFLLRKQFCDWLIDNGQVDWLLYIMTIYLHHNQACWNLVALVSALIWLNV